MNTDREPQNSKPLTLVQLYPGQLVLIAGAILGLGFLLGQQTEPTPATIAQPIAKSKTGNILPVSTTTIETTATYQTSQTYTGEVTASRSSEVGFERGGKLVTVLVEEGDSIEAGMALAKLDTANLEAEKQALVAQKAQAQAVLAELGNGARTEQIASAKATVKDLQQQLELEQLKSDRREYLYQEGVISREQLDEIAFNRNALNARLANAQSNLDELNNGTRQEQIVAQQAVVAEITAQIANLEITIAKSTLRAPFGGIVANRHLDEGAVVETGQSILRLVEDMQPEVKIGIPTTLVSRIPVGSQQTVQIADTTYRGRVKSILPEVDPATRTRTAVIQLNTDARGKVAPGQIARFTLTQDSTTDGYWLPIDALVKGDRGLWSCFAVVTNTNKVGDRITQIERRYIELLETREDRVLVRGTLQPGDRIVINGNHRLVPAQNVRVIN